MLSTFDMSLAMTRTAKRVANSMVLIKFNAIGNERIYPCNTFLPSVIVSTGGNQTIENLVAWDMKLRMWQVQTFILHNFG